MLSPVGSVLDSINVNDSNFWRKKIIERYKILSDKEKELLFDINSDYDFKTIGNLLDENRIVEKMRYDFKLIVNFNLFFCSDFDEFRSFQNDAGYSLDFVDSEKRPFLLSHMSKAFADYPSNSKEDRENRCEMITPLLDTISYKKYFRKKK